MGDDREGLGRQGRLTMHILILVVIGHRVLALFVLLARLLNKERARRRWRTSIHLGLAAGLHRQRGSGCGASRHPEVAAFVPIFGVPAAVAWYLSRRRRIGLNVYTSRRRDGSDLL